MPVLAGGDRRCCYAFDGTRYHRGRHTTPKTFALHCVGCGFDGGCFSAEDIFSCLARLRLPSPSPLPGPLYLPSRRLRRLRLQGALPYAESMLEEQKRQKEAAEAAAAAGEASPPVETKKTK